MLDLVNVCQRNRVSRIDDIVQIGVGRACYEVRAAVGEGPDVGVGKVAAFVGVDSRLRQCNCRNQT